jgi:hypothetical protein
LQLKPVSTRVAKVGGPSEEVDFEELAEIVKWVLLEESPEGRSFLRLMGPAGH